MLSWRLSRLTIRRSANFPCVQASLASLRAVSHIERQLRLHGGTDLDMLTLPQACSGMLHLFQRQTHELLQQFPKYGCVHAHLHNAFHAAAHQLVLKLLQDDCAHGVVILRQQMVVHTACMTATLHSSTKPSVQKVEELRTLLHNTAEPGLG